MAEKTKTTRKPREIKDAGQRTVLASIELDSHEIAARLAERAGHDIRKMKDEKDREKAIKPFLDMLEVLDGGGTTLWVKLGQVEADTREAAVNSILGPDVPGSFRAPNASAWRGQINRKPPEQIPLDIELVD
jgi:hypothetical protein